MAGLVMATVAVRFVFPSVSVEGLSFWIIRASPISMRDFLWSKFWTGLIPVLLLTELVTVAANEFLGVDPFLKWLAAGAVVMMSFALVGLATGMGARYPRFGADPAEVSGSFGGVAFMIQAVLFIIVMIALLGWPSSMFAFRQLRGLSPSPLEALLMGACFIAAAATSVAIWLLSMRSGVAALDQMAG
jgi:ABC-2 type transport system permease protein